MTSSRCINLHFIFLILIVADCGNLTDPANGQVTLTAGTTFGQTATYSCNTGYNLVENSTRTCQDTGEWSESAPTCQSMLLKGDMVLLSYLPIHKKHSNVYLGLAYLVDMKVMEGYGSVGWCLGKILATENGRPS